MFFFLIAIILISITFHEYAHGWVAYKLGDSTPKEAGRLTLNPLAHIDPLGTVILPVLLLMISRGAFAFGYAKPVPINPLYFKNPKTGMRLIGVAGPLANFAIAVILSLILRISRLILPQAVSAAIVGGIVINLILGIFNLIPIPPLDGSKVVASFLPYRLAYNYLRMEMIGFLLIPLLIIIGFFETVIGPLVAVGLFLLGV